MDLYELHCELLSKEKLCAQSFINQNILSVYKVFSFCAKCINGFTNEALATHGTSRG